MTQLKHYTRGGQISFHNLRMWDQITKTLIWICFSAWIITTLLLTWYFTSSEMLIQTFSHYMALVLDFMGHHHQFDIPHHGHMLKVTTAIVAHDPFYIQTATNCLKAFYKAIHFSFILMLVLGTVVILYFIYKGKKQTQNQFIRGATLLPSDVLKKQIIKSKKGSDITIDGFPLIEDSEVQHLLVHGTVGTGKSQLIMKLIDNIRARGDKAIIYDKGCTFISHYFQEKKDIILNPFDARCAHWDLWREAPMHADLENMAESLIPIQGESDPFWVNAARTVFVSAAETMRQNKYASLSQLLELLLTSDFKELEAYLAQTPVATLMSSKIEKTAISIRSVITTYLNAMRFLTDLEGAPFSIRDYLLNESTSGWLFISSNGEHHKALKPLMSMWLAMASLTLLSLEPNHKRRIWLICDELPSLHRLPLLGETIAEVRKFGGCFVLGMQNFSQLEKIYGKSGAQEIFDLLNTRFFFRSPSGDMARLVSRELGEEDIDESREHYSYGANSVRDGISLSHQRVVRPIVSYPEIAELPNLECYLRLPGQYPITHLKLKHQVRKRIADGFQLRRMNAAPIYIPPMNDKEKAYDYLD